MSGGEARELRRLATLERNRGDEQVRWSWDEFTPDDGEPTRYVSARKWYRTDGGEWRPTKAGITIRLAELDEVVAALERVQRARNGQGGSQRRPASASATGGTKGPSETARRAVSCEELDAEGVF